MYYHLICLLNSLVRSGYEEKADYFASLAANVLKSAHKALDTVQQTDE